MSIRDFYDGLAPDYHLVYEDWTASIQAQGAALDALIQARTPGARTVHDCSCGIGTQALGLARLGYQVSGTDISESSIERARTEAHRLGLNISFGVCDFRGLAAIPDPVDVVISCDNAIPHLLTDDDLARAFQSMRLKLRPGGLLVITVRDYDKALVERPTTAQPIVSRGEPRQVLVRLNDWDSKDSPLHTLHLLVLTEGSSGWSVEHHSTRYRAIGRAPITRAVEAAGFSEVRWYAPDEVNWYQPVMTAVSGT